MRVGILGAGSIAGTLSRTINQLNDPNIELIFVQHGPNISSEKAKEAYKRFQSNSTIEGLTITHLPGQNPVFPVAFSNGDLVISRKADQYLIATPSS